MSDGGAGVAPTALRRALLEWYRRNRRPLPWRDTRDPYRIWVSEVMLQQTTVKAVLPYYEGFLRRFPTAAALAAAAPDEVLAAWSGLGYYQRARNLHRGAQRLLERHGGRFPRTLEGALDLPGVGLYTASAVLSIAHGLPLPVVDGNVRRVLARLLAARGRRWRSDGPFYNAARELMEAGSPGEWNQALMELGAMVCTPRQPACPVCPLRSRCRALAEGLIDELPERKDRRRPVQVKVAAALVQDGGRVLLVRRGEGRLMGGMWEVPQTGLSGRGLPDLVPELAQRHALHVVRGPLLARVAHTITFRRLRVEVYAARLRRRLRAEAGRHTWVEPAALSLPVSSLTRKILRAVGSGQMPLPLGERAGSEAQ